MDFVANFIRFPAVQKFENQLRFDKVTESLKVGTFLRHSVQVTGAPPPLPNKQHQCSEVNRNNVSTT